MYFSLKPDQLPSAAELNVPEFIDRYVDEVYLFKDQECFKAAFNTTKLTKHSDIKLDDVEDKHLKSFLDENLKAGGEIDKERIANHDFKSMTTSEFLNTIKSHSIKAYLTTEKISLCFKLVFISLTNKSL